MQKNNMENGMKGMKASVGIKILFWSIISVKFQEQLKGTGNGTILRIQAATSCACQ